MATISREFLIEASPNAVWERISDAGAVNELIDFVGDVTLDGDRRYCAIGEEGRLDELIVSVDDASKRFVYSIRESPFGFEHHSASWQTLGDDDGRTRFVWIADFKPDAVAPALETAIDQAVVSIKRALS